MARRRKKRSNGGGGGAGEGWLTTYTDLCTLLMTFFVLLLSMSVMDENRKREALSSLVGAFGILPAGRSAMGEMKGIDVTASSAPIESTSPLDFKLLKEMTFKNKLDADIEVSKEGDKLLLKISDRVLFESTGAALRPEMKAYLSVLAARLKPSKYDIEIRGYTDPYEDIDGHFSPNRDWIVSTERAEEVSAFLVEQGLSVDRISAHGFGSYWPVVDSVRYPHLRYKNSRVEIVLGRNETLPTTLIRQEPRPIPFFRYKNFWFRLFPGKKPEADKGPG